MNVLLTGADGFLGWHTRLRLHALTDHVITSVTRENWSELPALMEHVDSVIHIAGVNRGPDVAEGNVRLADDLVAAVMESDRPLRFVFANSVQHGNGTPYGTGKAEAAARLEAAVERRGGRFVDVRLPNLFGEHGRPSYNSFVATFVRAVIEGIEPTIIDRPVELLHVQGAAQALIDALTATTRRLDPRGAEVTVQGVLDLLREFKASYDTGEFPDLSSDFRIDLFNTYRSALFPAVYPIALTPHTDARGRFVETVRCRGGEGQTSFSTTVPGVTRGEHYHLRKVERFAVIDGRATISLRRMFTDEVIDFFVDGTAPCAIDMPTGWVHNITNTADETLLTQFWSHELFRSDVPDTFPEPVRPAGGSQ